MLLTSPKTYITLTPTSLNTKLSENIQKFQEVLRKYKPSDKNAMRVLKQLLRASNSEPANVFLGRGSAALYKLYSEVFENSAHILGECPCCCQLICMECGREGAGVEFHLLSQRQSSKRHATMFVAKTRSQHNSGIRVGIKCTTFQHLGLIVMLLFEAKTRTAKTDIDTFTTRLRDVHDWIKYGRVI